MTRSTKVATAAIAMANAMEALDVQPTVVAGIRASAVRMILPPILRGE